MNFDAKLFGSRLKAAVLAKYTPGEAVRKLQEGGLYSFTPPRLSEYFSGSKVPTLERFSHMVDILGLDVRIVFPGWGQKVRAIRHPSQKGKPLMEVLAD
jgi:hypothetical protein